MSVPTAASSPNATTPPEIEQTLTMLSGHRSVLGYLVLSRAGTVSIIKHSGVVFEGDQGRKYAGVIERIVDSVQTGLEEISGEQNEGVSRRSLERERKELISLAQDEIRFLRIRTKRHELMISPSTRHVFFLFSFDSLTPLSFQRRGICWPSCMTHPLRHTDRFMGKQ